VATRVVYVEDGRCDEYLGNYDDFVKLRAVAQAEGAARAAAVAANATVDAKVAPSKGKEARRLDAQRRDEIRKRTGPLRAAVERLEAEIVRRETRVAQIVEELAQPDAYADLGRVAEISRERATLDREVAALSEEWEKAASELEAVEEAIRAEGSA
jgi:ATP-binding cassette subfamily F protein 3